MPRPIVLVLACLLLAAGAGAQDLGVPTAHWTLSAPQVAVRPGELVTVTAEVRLPPGYYQDADSPFLRLEPAFDASVTTRSSSAPTVRQGKSSYSGTFRLSRTFRVPQGAPGAVDFAFHTGWQICQVDGVCLLPVEKIQTVRLVMAGTPEPGAFWAALVGAFLGGLLLNLMPCVFPVLALKALALASSAGLPRRERRFEALAFAAGGLGSLVVLGLGTAAVAALGERLDWGFPFQQPGFVWALILVFGAVTLPLLGIGTGWSPFTRSGPIRKSQSSTVGAGAFLVVAALPCTAPILGPALGYALSRPAFEIPWFFGAIGLGLVLPLLLLQVFPDWGRRFPKPGRWLTVVERLAGVLLLGTTAYLVWVFGSQVGFAVLVPALGVLAALAALMAWSARTPGRLLGRTLKTGLVVLAVASFWLVVEPKGDRAPVAVERDGWQAFSPTRLEAALASGRPVFVDATAAWCATCQVNEWAILGRADVLSLLDARGVVRIRADYTKPDPQIQQWLRSVDRAGLPVYALYRPGRPVYLFSELLTDDNFNRTLPALLAP